MRCSDAGDRGGASLLETYDTGEGHRSIAGLVPETIPSQAMFIDGIAKEIGCLMPLSRLMMSDADGPGGLTSKSIFLLPMLLLPSFIHPKYVMFDPPPRKRAR